MKLLVAREHNAGTALKCDIAGKVNIAGKINTTGKGNAAVSENIAGNASNFIVPCPAKSERIASYYDVVSSGQYHRLNAPTYAPFFTY